MFIAISSEIQSELMDLNIPTARCALIPNGVDVDRFQPVSAEQKALLRETMGLPAGHSNRALCRAARAGETRSAIDLRMAGHKSGRSEALLIVAGSGRRGTQITSDGRPRRSAHWGNPGCRPSPAIRGCVCAAVRYGRTVGRLVGGSCFWFAGDRNIGRRCAGRDPAHGERVSHSPDDVHELQRALLTLLSDTSLRARLGECGRQRTASAYSLDLVADRLASVYRGLLPSSKITD